jgi:hypothetical protein
MLGGFTQWDTGQEMQGFVLIGPSDREGAGDAPVQAGECRLTPVKET